MKSSVPPPDAMKSSVPPPQFGQGARHYVAGENLNKKRLEEKEREKREKEEKEREANEKAKERVEAASMPPPPSGVHKPMRPPPQKDIFVDLCSDLLSSTANNEEAGSAAA